MIQLRRMAMTQAASMPVTGNRGGKSNRASRLLAGSPVLDSSANQIFFVY